MVLFNDMLLSSHWSSLHLGLFSHTAALPLPQKHEPSRHFRSNRRRNRQSCSLVFEIRGMDFANAVKVYMIF